MNDLVSVILPYYNGSRFVQETVDSIRAQTHRNFEVLVIDDGSPDPKESAHIKDLVEGLKDERFKYLRKTNGGLSDARNFGIANSNGALIAFIDQDDCWRPAKLERQIQAMNAAKGVEFVFTDMDVIARDGSVRRFELPRWFGRDSSGVVAQSYRLMLRQNFVSASSVLFTKNMAERAGPSKPSYTVCPDYELFIRMARLKDFYYLREPLLVYRLHDGNTTRQAVRLLSECIWILFENKAATAREKLAATVNFLELSAKLSKLWVLRLMGE